MTNHPTKGLGFTKRQREVFEQIVIGNALPRAGRKTIETLMNYGLIERAPDKILGRDRFGTITIPQYYVPLPIHMQFCAWASEQPLPIGMENE